MCSQLIRAKAALHKSMSTALILTYAFFIMCVFAVYVYVAEGNRSSAATLSVMAQCFALVLLVLKVTTSGHVKGISCNSLALEASAFVCRLSGTTWRDGYLPVDASGDWLYQAVDVASLLLALWLLREMLFAKRATYEEEHDAFPMREVVLGCFVVAMLMHANLHGHPLCDCLWMAGLLMSVVAVIPQYNLIIKSGGCVEALTSHYMAATGLSRILSGMFMWNCREYIGCAFWIQDINHAIIVILGAHLLHLVLLTDFAYYYLNSVATRGLSSSLNLMESVSV
jgi:hypothetical protein